MDDRGLRDIERWRDKIEVRLDNRQVFFLFFGSALVACMLFVLGVIVGKRLESRGRAVSPEIEDPLALLDKVATSPRPAQGGVTFPQALFGTAGKNGTATSTAKKNLLPAAADSEIESAKPARGQATEAKPATEAKTRHRRCLPKAGHARKPDTKASQDRDQSRGQGRGTAQGQARDQATKVKATRGQGRRDQARRRPRKRNPPPFPTIAAGGDSKSKGHFTLQLSSFQDKAEAEAFAQKFVGERPYMVVSEIPGKGTWYRVRVGDYASSKDAVAAKESFEKKHNVIAYVAQR